MRYKAQKGDDFKAPETRVIEESFPKKQFKRELDVMNKMSDNRLVKIVTDSTVLIGLSAGLGWVAKKALKENFL